MNSSGVALSETDLISSIEDACFAIGRLDTRLSLSPLREAWQVRAACRAAISLAAVDGVHVREADLIGIMVGSRLPVAESYLGAGIALGWWRRAMGRIVLSDVTKRLLGQKVTRHRAAMEAQAEFDADEHLTPLARRTLAAGGLLADPDEWADAGARRALEAMRAQGTGLTSLAKGVRDVLSQNRDPGFHDRSWHLKGILADQAEAQLEADCVDMSQEAAQARRCEVEEMLASLDWEGPRALGEAHMAVPDRLLEMGMTSMRLTILTGATKRIAIERRGDPRAVAGFLHQLTREAREGMALLDALEMTVARWSASPALSADRRSSLPDILWAVLVLPAVDAAWLEDALDLSPRVIQKFVHRLAALDLISHWSQRRTEGLVSKSTDVRLWVADGFEADLDRSMRASRVWTRSGRVETRRFADVLQRVGDVDVSVPMADVFRRFDEQMIDIDRQYGHLW